MHTGCAKYIYRACWACYKHCRLPLWATYIYVVYKSRTLGKGYGIKCGVVENTLRTYWEFEEPSK
jgi:hypothetical protein